MPLFPFSSPVHFDQGTIKVDGLLEHVESSVIVRLSGVAVDRQQLEVLDIDPDEPQVQVVRARVLKHHSVHGGVKVDLGHLEVLAWVV